MSGGQNIGSACGVGIRGGGAARALVLVMVTVVSAGPEAGLVSAA